MKKISKKFIGIIFTMLLVTVLMPNVVLGENESSISSVNNGLQIVKTENNDYIIYIKDMEKAEFEFVISNNEKDTDYIEALEDNAGNKVALITKTKYEDMKDNDIFLNIKQNDKVTTTKVDLSTAFSQAEMELVEGTTQRIVTNLVEDLVQKDVEENGVKIKVTVGGLKIEGNKDSKYFYAITKLPKEKYDRLQKLANYIKDDYDNMNMYTKIETSREFYNLYTQLKGEQDWKEVNKDLTIIQPDDAKVDEEYIVYIKEEDKNGKEISVDMKMMKSYRTDREETIPGRTETKVVKETTKLPITGDSIILFVILAVIILVAIILFIRMKKLQENSKEK